MENPNDRYVNPKIELELIDFKKEIEEKFASSKLRSYNFPFIRKEHHTKLPNPTMRSARYASKNSDERSNASSSIGGSIDNRRSGNN